MNTVATQKIKKNHFKDDGYKFTHKRKAGSCDYDYRYLHNTRNLRGLRSNSNTKILCIGSWLDIKDAELFEIFRVARYSGIKIETRAFGEHTEHHIMFKEAFGSENHLQKSLTKIFLTDDELHKFILDKFNYNK